MKSLIIDNYDSFTYNLYQLIAEINQQLPVVIKNDQLSWQEIKQLSFDNIIISPGPGNPCRVEDTGVCREVFAQANIPILGVCLGHQGLGYYYNATIGHAPEPKHGRISKIRHNNDRLFKHIPSEFAVVRYHSLIISDPLPDHLIEIANSCDDNLIMGIRHRDKPFWGVQFHPESICSEYGKQLLINFQQITTEFKQKQDKKSALNLSVSPPKITSNCSYKNNFNNTIASEQIISIPNKVYSQKLDFFIDSEVVFSSLYANSDNSFWLDSSMVAPNLSRFSFMGDAEGQHSFIVKYQVKDQQIKIIKKKKVTLLTGDIYDFLGQILTKNYCVNNELPFRFNCGFVGYFGYELKSLCGTNNIHESSLPDAEFIFADRLIVFDHQESKIYLLYLDEENYPDSAENWFKEITIKLNKLLRNNNQKLSDINFNNIEGKLIRKKQKYLDDIQVCLNNIKEGESYEICLTNQLFFPAIKQPFLYYCYLRKNNPVPYSAYLKLGENTIVSLSPERFLSLDKQGWLEAKPIKGTSPRGKNIEEDLQLKKSLKCSEKEQAENLMIVDLLRNDLGKVCQVGTVYVPKLMAIETYSTVHQMVSTIRGKKREDVNPLECIRASFPGGSMTGAPKKRTMEIIDQLETTARGIYSGSIGFLGLNNTFDLNIVIRTAVVTNKQTSIGVGGAITALSLPEKEFAEILLKAQALIGKC